MRRTALTLLACLLAAAAFCQDKAAQIANLEAQLNAVQATYAPIEQRLKALDVDRSNNQFAADAYKKYNAKYSDDVNSFNNQQDEVNRQQDMLNTSVVNYKQRLAQHNANKCVQVAGSGTCNWYNNEADQLNANQAQIAQAQTVLDQSNRSLDTQRQSLVTTKSQLDTIWNQGKANDDKYVAAMDQLKADYRASRAKELELQRQLAILKGDRAACFKAIPPACQNPAVGPDGKPILDQDCERMHAACGKMFDGN